MKVKVFQTFRLKCSDEKDVDDNYTSTNNYGNDYSFMYLFGICYLKIPLWQYVSIFGSRYLQTPYLPIPI